MGDGDLFGKVTPLPIEGIVDTGSRSYDITPDGKYFVVALPKPQDTPGKAPPEQINVKCARRSPCDK